jgi:hypothetical protein
MRLATEDELYAAKKNIPGALLDWQAPFSIGEHNTNYKQEDACCACARSCSFCVFSSPATASAEFPPHTVVPPSCRAVEKPTTHCMAKTPSLASTLPFVSPMVATPHLRSPIEDGVELTEAPRDSLAKGDFASNVTVLLGTNADEGSEFVAVDYDVSEAEAEAYMSSFWGPALGPLVSQHSRSKLGKERYEQVLLPSFGASPA